MRSEYGALMREYLADRYPDRRLHADIDSGVGYDPVLWLELSTEIGLSGLSVPERYGGSGAAIVDLVAVAVELGRSLACVPFLSSAVLASNAVLLTDDADWRAQLLPSFVSGSATGTVAYVDRPGSPARARRDARAWRIDGAKVSVVDGGTATHLLVFAETPDGTGLFLVDSGSAGLTVRDVPTMDLTRPLAELHLDSVAATLIGSGARVDGILARLIDLAGLFLGAEAVGGAERCLQLSIEHAKARYQFGRPIGSFQAVKHRCADVLIELELARSAVEHAAASVSDDREFRLAVSIAKAFCADTYAEAAGASIQIHGGIGFTWEHTAQLHLKRARGTAVLFGNQSWHRGRVAALVELARAYTTTPETVHAR